MLRGEIWFWNCTRKGFWRYVIGYIIIILGGVMMLRALGVAVVVSGVGLFLLGKASQKEGAYGVWHYLLMGFALVVGLGAWWLNHG